MFIFGGNEKKKEEKNEKENKNNEQENNLGKALRNKIVIKIFFNLFQAENMIDQTAEYVSKSYLEKIFFCLK